MARKTDDTRSLIALIEHSVKEHWNIEALTDYRGATLRYRDVAEGIERIGLLFEAAGVKRGDKVALCGRNCSEWGVVFLATLCHGAVSVPILHDFKADNVHNIVNHSEAKLLFVGDAVWENLDEEAMPQVKGIFSLGARSLLAARSSKVEAAFNGIGKAFARKFPSGLTPGMVSYRRDEPEELAVINYTSGTTSFSKGVLLPYRSLWSNVRFAMDNIALRPGDRHVCILPLAHAFGLMFEFVFEFVVGCHTYFLTRMPSPKIIFQAYRDVKPNLVITVPLVVEKVVRKGVMPQLAKPAARLMLKLPVARDLLMKKVRGKLNDLFGGNVLELVIGGAAMNEEVEGLLNATGFPYTIGYGMTECGPLICYSGAAGFRKGSCGRPVERIELKIDSEDPGRIPGEILVRGENVTTGYYKNKEATEQCAMPGGWFRTGDLATQDSEGNVFIKGRSKNMILGANGQNIYPEEIEDKFNGMRYVAESVVVGKGGKIVALVHPDYNEAIADGVRPEDMAGIMERNRVAANALLPRYSQVAEVKIFAEEFEKTPKQSIKRYLYQ